ncbi:aminoglycoside phosphotransferase family protein [Cutibacterium equinum]|uniref:Aminoglycoside phosphotransferase family protein n=1 Tax=Cutibacterium equinum TaxID=3016342 RepID=A0ABY7QWJ6_9ACTN|nr:aminoglycoside phosphotransferase family protein [Cutibacterium equinum]WCC79434.1 aminoglycoside phosphotransferase family protein [Cutibacterium equinum]
MKRPAWLGGPGKDADGAVLLTGPEAGKLLKAAVEHADGILLEWHLDHVDANPGQSTTATYQARVQWPTGERQELFGMSARVNGPAQTDARADIYVDGSREVAVWRYPDDPDLPGLSRAAYPEQMAAIVSQLGLVGGRVSADEITIRMIGYRPRRRAVLSVEVAQRRFYVKVLREGNFQATLARHDLLTSAGVPSPRVVGITDDNLLFLAELPGRPLSKALFEPGNPCTAEGLIGLLDQLPAQVCDLPRRSSWSDSVDHYCRIVAAAMPDQQDRLDRMADIISQGLTSLPPGNEPTHGDFHEGQIHVWNGQVCGILDVDTIGPGRRADDLACLVAHLSTVQRMTSCQADRMRQILAQWVPVFDSRVDPVELRLRSAAVAISLATGPYRSQEANWGAETMSIIDAAEALVNQVA